jgi:chorismate mutase
MSDLQTFRDQIDAIDDQLISLLKERTQIVRKVGALKTADGENGLFIRPGREGRMHQRIYDAFQGTGFNAEAAVGIWRLMIAASTHLESPLSLAVPSGGPWQMLAREYFGNFVPLQEYSSITAAAGAVADGKQNIAILPWPDPDNEWWVSFSQYCRDGLHVFAALPVAEGPHGTPAALAAGYVTPEPSDSDVSYFHVSWNDEGLSSSRVSSLVPGSIIRNYLAPDNTRHLLVKLERFAAADDAAVAKLGEDLPALNIRYLGAHPAPVKVA